MSDFVSSVPSLAEDPWVGVPSRQRRRHWEVICQLMLEPAVSDVRRTLCRVRRARMAVDWRPDRKTTVAAAANNARALLYLLVEMPTDMLIWALNRAADGDWFSPSQNFHEGVSTRRGAHHPVQY
jgi:hypothetical protein